MDRGWVPHDEGVLGQSAERVLDGQLPQRDFDDVYTGGLSLLHAAAFHVLGTRLHSLRIVLLAAFVPFVWALFRLASRFATPAGAAALTVLGVAWSVPNYFASMPSWYDLFLATFACLALSRHVESGRRRWLVAAGALAGVSILVKLHGVFLLAACVLFAFDRERRTAPADASLRPARGYLALVAAALGVFVGSLAALVATRGGRGPEYVYFVLPAAAIATYLFTCELRRGGRGSAGARLARLWRIVLPILVGAAAPLVLFAAPYVLSGSFRELVAGTLMASSRLTTPSLGVPLPSWEALAPGLVYAATLLVPAKSWSRRRRLAANVLGPAGVLALLAFARTYPVYSQIFESARSLAPFAVVAGIAALARRARTDAEGSPTGANVFVVLAMAAMVLMVQFPFSAPIYFCFAAPLVAVTVGAVVALERGRPRLLDASVLVLYLVYGLLDANPVYVFRFGRTFERYVAGKQLDPIRAGIRVPASDADVYRELVDTVRQESPGGRVVAGPDCPEVYFLSGRENPDRSLVAFLGPARGDPDSAVRLLEARHNEVVVINRRPDFSPPVSPAMVDALGSMYPRRRDVGRFTVFSKHRESGGG